MIYLLRSGDKSKCFRPTDNLNLSIKATFIIYIHLGLISRNDQFHSSQKVLTKRFYSRLKHKIDYIICFAFLAHVIDSGDPISNKRLKIRHLRVQCACMHGHRVSKEYKQRRKRNILLGAALLFHPLYQPVAFQRQ